MILSKLKICIPLTSKPPTLIKALRYLLCLMLILSSLPAFAQFTVPEQAPLQRAEYIMGTLFVVSLPPQHAELFAGVFQRLRDYDRALSDYLPDSELNQVLLRAEVSLGQPGQGIAVSNILCQALSESSYYQTISGGAFNISLEPLMQIWGFKTRDYRLPDRLEIERALQKVSPSPYLLEAPLVLTKEEVCRFQLLRSGARLDFGAIGKGLALDAAMNWLKKQGVDYAALDAGGSTQIFWGSPPDKSQAKSKAGWPVRLRSAGDPALAAKIYWLDNQAISSSNQNQQFFTLNGQVYGHILDPRTGYPALPTQQVTVIAPTASQADALSTILLLSQSEQDYYYQRLFNLQIIRY